MQSLSGRSFLGAVSCGLLLLAGCAGGSSNGSSQSGGSGGSNQGGGSQTPLTDVALTGTAYGGQQTIVGAHVYLFAANTTGYGGAGIAASTSNASVSLLSAAETGASDSVGAYVATGSNGGFSLTGDYSCTSGQQLYLYVLGGNTGSGTNSSAGLMAAIGSCPASGSPAIAVTVNEVTTIAAAYALAGFATDATHVSSSGTALAKTGLAAAFVNANSLVPASTGVAPATTASGNATVPQAAIGTLGNILAKCVETAASCSSLFSTATSDSTPTGTVPTDTATAAINIAHHPGANVAALYALAAGGAFSPQLSAVPNDFTLALNFTGGGLYGPYAVAIDASGNAWVADWAFTRTSGSAVTEIASSGAFLTGATGFTNAAIYTPDTIAVDDSGNAWIGDNSPSSSFDFANEISSAGSLLPPPHGYSSAGSNRAVAIDGQGNVWFAGTGVIEFNSSGAAGAPPLYYGGVVGTSNAMAIDGAGSAWIPSSAGTVTKLSSTGTLLSGTNGYTASGCCSGYGVAIDSSGNAWIAGTPGVVEFSNSGAVLSGANGFTGGGLNGTGSIAIDGAGKVWALSGSLVELSSAGAVLSGTNGYKNSNIFNAAALAIDGSGDIWVTNQGVANGPLFGNVLEFIGVATPVITPIAAGLPATPTVNGSSNLGTRP
jgi:hypothetical protein